MTSAKKTFIPRYVPYKGPEEKFVLGTGVTIATNANALFTAPGTMNLLAQGVTTTTRIGGEVRFKTIEIRYTYYPGIPTSGVTPSDQLRIIIAYDKASKGAEPLATDILFAPAHFDSPIKSFTAGSRFIILADKITKLLSAEADTADRMIPISGKIFIKCDLQTIFQGPNAAITDLVLGGISIMFAQNANTGITGAIEFDGLLRFVDA